MAPTSPKSPVLPSAELVASDQIVFREVDWEKDHDRVFQLWADGFRIVIPLYWKEIVFSFEYLPLIILGSLLAASITVYFAHLTTVGPLLEVVASMFCTHWLLLTVYSCFFSLFPFIGYYIFMYRGANGFIKNSGVRANYDKFWVALLDDYIIACVGLKGGRTLTDDSVSDVCSIWRLTVDEEYRQYGLGRRMMKICEDYAAQHYSEIKLLAGNIASIKFYDKLGYTRESVAWKMGRHVSLNFTKSMKKIQ